MPNTLTLTPKYTKAGDLTHSDGCKMAFGRKDLSCPRCIELANGASARSWKPSNDSVRFAEISDHYKSHKHLSGGCGPVCTFGDW